MSITYTSPFHSPEDPGGLIKQVLDMGESFQGPAEDVLLSWAMRLDVTVDAQGAAKELLARYGVPEGPLSDSPRGRMIELLREAAKGGLPRAPGPRRSRRQRRP
jgi:hypothetical protein